jgi:hypothetical protein
VRADLECVAPLSIEKRSRRRSGGSELDPSMIRHADANRE